MHNKALYKFFQGGFIAIIFCCAWGFCQIDRQINKNYAAVIQEFEQKRIANLAQTGDVEALRKLAASHERAGKLEDARHYYALAARQGDKKSQEALQVLSQETEPKKRSALPLIASGVVVSGILLGAILYLKNMLHVRKR